MSEINPEIPPVPEKYDSVWLEEQLKKMQQQIFLLREFLEPAVVNNKNCPNQTFSALE